MTAVLPADTPLLVDGGLSTALEQAGVALDHPLWTARALIEQPQQIERAHRAFLQAGADLIISASYQASLPGFVARGLSDGDAAGAIAASQYLAEQAVINHQPSAWQAAHGLPRVATSIGPYGASLADGSEYRGDYVLTRDQLRAFHEPRWEVLLEAGAQLMALETIPSALEAEVLLDLLEQSPDVTAWLSFTCRNDDQISDGTPLMDACARAAELPQVLALGANCIDPDWALPIVGDLIKQHDKPVVMYPNRGGCYDAANKCWHPSQQPAAWGDRVRSWVASGAWLVGGCCGIGPAQVAQMRHALPWPASD